MTTSLNSTEFASCFKFQYHDQSGNQELHLHTMKTLFYAATCLDLHFFMLLNALQVFLLVHLWSKIGKTLDSDVTHCITKR